MTVQKGLIHMRHTISNGFLTLTADTHGAEPVALQPASRDDLPLLWDAQHLWPRSSPFCFPWVSKLENGYFEHGGKRYSGGQHGFARDVEHTLAGQTEHSLTYVLEQSAPDGRWPWPFRLTTEHKLVYNRLVTTCTVENLGGEAMPVQMGFHTAVRVPFIPRSSYTDYQVHFEKREAPDGGYLLPLTEHLFDNDSICFAALKSDFIDLECTRRPAILRFETKGFPYVLVWSKPGEPQFLCIEPWTGYYGPGADLFRRPGAVSVAPGERFSARQSLAWSIV